jgi:hypothetical protein
MKQYNNYYSLFFIKHDANNTYGGIELYLQVRVTNLFILHRYEWWVTLSPLYTRWKSL